MYDIQGALRRRAMAERLEALSRAAEATERAATSPENLSRARHLADGAPLDFEPGWSSTDPDPDWSPSTDPDPDWSPSTDDGLSSPRLGFTPIVPQPAPPITPINGAETDAPPSEEAFSATFPVDQTIRLRVPTSRIEASAPPPLRDADFPVPQGVTLLHDSLTPPLSEPPHLDEDRLAGAFAQEGLDALTETDNETGYETSYEVDPTAAPEVLFSAPDLDQDDLDQDDTEDSSATTIADLLRHGGSGLFFKR